MSLPLGCFNRPWNKFEYEEALAGIAAAGFEITGTMRQQGRLLVSAETSEGQVKQLRTKVEEAGLKPSAVLGDFPMSGALDESVVGLKRLIDNTAVFGAQFVLLCGTSDEELYDRFYETVKACCDYGMAKGIVLTLKPHGGISTSGADLLQAVQRIDHNAFGIYYDPGNIVYYGGLNPVAEAKSIGQYTVAMCVKDMLSQGEGVMISPGSGNVDFEGVFDVLCQAGFEGPCLVECLAGETRQDVNEEAKKAHEFLMSLLG